MIDETIDNFEQPPVGGPLPAAPLSYAQPAGFGILQDWHTLPTFDPMLAAVYHVITVGFFSLFHFQMMHDRLPKNRPSDPSAAKAIGFMFIPFFNLGWMFFIQLRLIDRIDEQRRLAGLPERPLKALCIAMLVMLFIPYVNVFSFVIVHPIYLASLQSSVNELCKATNDM
jgi:hypothetical protein